MTVLERLQVAAVVVGTFMAFWGLSIFSTCVWRSLRGRYNQDVWMRRKCPWHCCWAMICLSGLFLCFARANVIGVFDFGSVVAGASFLAGIVGFTMAVGIAIWATALDANHPRLLPMRLSRIVILQLIIVAAFFAVGIVAGQE